MPPIVETARRLRQDETNAEMRLWSDLRDRRLNGFKFVRQFPIERFIVDFACRERSLIIELDGDQHGNPAAMRRDRERTAFLNDAGYSVLRFWDAEVLRERRAVLETILAALEGLALIPSPGLRFAPATLSPAGRGKRGGAVAGDRKSQQVPEESNP